MTAYGKWNVNIYKSEVYGNGEHFILWWDKEYQVDETHEDLKFALLKALRAVQQ